MCHSSGIPDRHPVHAPAHEPGPRTAVHSEREPATLADLLQQRASDARNRCEYSFTGDGITVDETLTCEQLCRQANAIAGRLRSLAAPGDRILIHVEPGLDFVRALFGCLCAGLVAVPSATGRRGDARTAGIRADCDPRLMIVRGDGRESESVLSIAGAGDDERPARLTALPLESPTGAEPRRGSSTTAGEVAFGGDATGTAAPADLCLLQYTSGSTSDPKGVMLTHANLLHNLRMIATAFEATSDSRGVIWLPPFHDMGLIGGLLVPLYAGFPVRLMSPRSFIHRPVRWLKAISEFAATISGGPTFAWDICTRRIRDSQLQGIDLRSWTVAFCGAEPIRSEVLDRFSERFAAQGFRRRAFLPCYGLAESTLMVTAGRVQDEPFKLTVNRRSLVEESRIVEQTGESAETSRIVSCGEARQQVLRIRDPQSGQLCDDGTVGEVCVIGDSVAAGYWNRPGLTQSIFRTDDPDGAPRMLATGDLGAVRKGELFLVGRLKDVLILHGQNLPAEDIEDVCVRSHAAIRAGSCAACVSRRDGEDQVTVLIEVARNTDPHVLRDIADTARSALRAAYGRIPVEIRATREGSLPRTSSGKIRRGACRQMLEAGRLRGLTAEPRTDIHWRAQPRRSGRALQDAVSRFAVESRARSWRELGVTLGLLSGAIAVSAWPVIGLPWRILSSVIAGVFLVRLFIVYHDAQHGAIFRGSATARALMSVLGVLTLTPPRNWRFSHNFHHARNSQFATSEIGSFPIMTTEQFERCSLGERYRYLAARSPLAMLAGYPVIFLVGFCIRAVLKDPRKYWDSGVAVLLHAALLLMLMFAGSDQVVWCYLVPLAVSMTLGSYLFYVQHNFPDVKLRPRQEWDFEFAALHSSSFLDVHPVIHWFTGNIGFHHVHHLNSRVPFYRLPEAFRAIPELQAPGRTDLSPREILRCLRLKLWDPEQGRLIGMREYRARRTSPTPPAPATPIGEPTAHRAAS